MIRTVNLLDYLPPFMREYREMQYIMTSEQPESQALCNESERIKNNQFIDHSDENGINRYERMLNITPNSDESLSDRKARIMAKWIDAIPYTMRVLKSKLDALLGSENHTETLDNANYTLNIETFLENSSRINALDELLENILPANLLWSTLYSNTSNIEYDTIISIYQNDFPFCGNLICGQGRDAL